MIELVVFRGIQGLGGGALLATVFASIADLFPDPARRARYQGLFFGVFSISSVIGPSLGGWITDAFDWRWIFFVNLPLGLLSLVALPFVLPQSERVPGAKIDFAGAGAITVSIVALLLALSWAGGDYGWDSSRVLVGLAIAAIAFAAFVPIELRASEPILPFSLFRDRTMASACFVMFFIGVGFFGVILYTPLFVQGVLGQTATGSGAVLTPLILTMTAVGIVGGFLMSKTNRLKPFLIAGTGVMAVGVFLLSTLGPGSSTLTVALFLFVTGSGMGLVMPTVTLAVQTKASPREIGVATSATQFIRSVGSTVGTAVIGTIVTAGYVDGLRANLPQGTTGPLANSLEDPNALVSPDALRALEGAAAQAPGGAALVDGLMTAAGESLSASIGSGFLLVLGATLLALVGALFMENLRLKEEGNLSEEAKEKEAVVAGATSTAAPREPRPATGGGRVTEKDLQGRSNA
jgi:EmrB/QacA subfamily drug resistance transporter